MSAVYLIRNISSSNRYVRASRTGDVRIDGREAISRRETGFDGSTY
jgi:hypothetical protein